MAHVLTTEWHSTVVPTSPNCTAFQQGGSRRRGWRECCNLYLLASLALQLPAVRLQQ